jgi:L-proline---[L-prolyl-carrier protein] ligase
VRFLVNHLLERSAAARPAATALIDGERTTSYGDLDAAANRVANVLLGLGVRRGDRVGLYLNKSTEAVVGIYGILKAGAAYVPLDPQAPPARLGYIARDAGISVLVSGPEQSGSWAAVIEAGAELSAIVQPDGSGTGPGGIDAPRGVRLLGGAEVAAATADPVRAGTVDCDLAYILYTSGSTGTPKGVMLTHRNCLAFVEWAAEEFAVGPGDCLSSHAPLHFDLSTFDLYAAALAGARLVLVPPAASIFPARIAQLIDSMGITVWYSVPSILTMLVTRGGLEPGALPGLRAVLFAGEVFPTPHLAKLRELLPHARLANLYGPTETNVCTWWEVSELPEDGGEAIPIGRAIANVDTFAVTDAGTRAEVGEVGELYVRGPTVMQGYLGDEERTALRLVEDPFSGILHQLVYRTGDLVRELPGGDYQFLGRRDSQIKSRGYRIELGDIESALGAHPAVLECAVVAVPDDLVSNRLEAFVSARVGTEVSKAELVSFCAERIPQYMIPERFEFPEALPRTSTGKIDRSRLAAEALAAAGGAAAGGGTARGVSAGGSAAG